MIFQDAMLMTCFSGLWFAVGRHRSSSLGDVEKDFSPFNWLVKADLMARFKTLLYFSKKSFSDPSSGN